jgi:hypothetical protein
MECLWYHRLVDRGKTLNQIHPAKIRYNHEPCFICKLEDYSEDQTQLTSTHLKSK